jgi:O-antigen/teichoic acid export membrane protein
MKQAMVAHTRLRGIMQNWLSSSVMSAAYTHLLRNSAGSLALNITSMVLGMATSILLARMLGVTDYGIYTYALSWIMVLATICFLGMHPVVLRNVATYQAQGAWGLLRGQLRWSVRAVLVAAVGVGLLASAIAWVLMGQSLSLGLITFMVACALLPIQAGTVVWQSALHGLHHVVQGQLPEKLVKPLALLVLLGVVWVLTGGTFNAVDAMTIQVITASIGLVASLVLLYRYLPSEARHSPAEYQGRVWLTSGMPFLLIAIVQILNNRGGILLLGMLTTPAEVGIYAVASRIAEMLVFIMGAINMALSPMIVDFYTKKDMYGLQRLVTISSWAMMLCTLPVVLGLLVFGHWVLQVFGAEFVQGYTALMILSIAQLFNVAVGPVGILLNMTKHERYTIIGLVASLVINIILNLVFVPIWGANGAAFASAVSLVTWNVLLAFWVYQHLKVYPSIFGIFPLLSGRGITHNE